MKSFGWSVNYVRKQITGAQGWAYFCWATAEACGGYMNSLPVPEQGYGWQEKERIKKCRQN
jgi:hypothetical protein